MRSALHLIVTMRPARQAMHFFITSIGMALWVVAMAIMGVCCWLSRAAHRTLPDSEIQNCWLAVLWRWHKYGGYLAVRPADGTRLWHRLKVPSAIWIQELPRRGVKLSQFVPTKRKQPRVCPAIVGYYVGEVRTVEAPHNATEE